MSWVSEEGEEGTHVESHVDLSFEDHRELVLETASPFELVRLHRDLRRRDLEDVALGRGAKELEPLCQRVRGLQLLRELAVVDLADREEAEEEVEVAVDVAVGGDASNELGANRRACVEAVDFAVVKAAGEDGNPDPVDCDGEAIEYPNGALLAGRRFGPELGRYEGDGGFPLTSGVRAWRKAGSCDRRVGDADLLVHQSLHLAGDVEEGRKRPDRRDNAERTHFDVEGELKLRRIRRSSRPVVHDLDRDRVDVEDEDLADFAVERGGELADADVDVELR